jgi:hypothetical protein
MPDFGKITGARTNMRELQSSTNIFLESFWKDAPGLAAGDMATIFSH